MENAQHKLLIEAYLMAFRERNLSQCLTFYAEDATIKFLMSSYRGKQAIEKWHKERFQSDVQLLNIEAIHVNGDAVTVDVLATSRRLRSFMIKSVKATGTFLVHDEQINEAKFAPRMGVASHLDWQFG